LKAESDGTGQGSTFTLYLPVADGGQRHATNALKGSRARRRLADRDDVPVLVADDEPDSHIH
jgi:hypothetical protein